MEEAGKNSDEQDINKCRSIINDGNNFLSLIIKTLTTAYYLGIFISSIIFISYFIYIKYIPNVKTAFILDGLVFVLLLGLFLTVLFVIMGFPGIYFLLLYGDNNIKGKEIKEKSVTNENENLINAHRKKFLLIIAISTFLFVLIALFLINLNIHSQLCIWFVIIFVPIIFSIISSLVYNKNLEKIISKKIFCKFFENILIYILYYILIIIFVTGLFSPILNRFNIKYDEFLAYSLLEKFLIYLAISLIFLSTATFFNAITFDITALIKNRNDIYYLKKHATDILIPLVVFLFFFIVLHLYTFPFNYFKLGSFEKNVIVNKYGDSILKTAGYPYKYINSYTNNSACSKPDECFKVKTFILSDIGSNIYLESKVYNKTQGKNKLLNNKYVHVLVPQKDFLFISYKNKLAKNKKTNNIYKKSKK